MASWQAFDVAAAAYDRWYETPLGSFIDRVERQALLGLLEPRPGTLIVDVGSGTGRYARELTSIGARCLGIDPSSEMVAVARRKGGGAGYVLGVAERLPVVSHAADAVLFVTTLEFVDNVEVALGEAVRAAKPGGRLVIGALHARGLWAAQRRRGTGIWKEARFFERSDLKSRLAAHGEVRSELVVHVPPQLSGTPKRLLPIVDRLLRRIAPGSGAFIAIRVDLRR